MKRVLAGAASRRWKFPHVQHAFFSTENPPSNSEMPYARGESAADETPDQLNVVDFQTQALSHLTEESDAYSERVHVVSQLQRQGGWLMSLRSVLFKVMVGYSAAQAQGLVDAMQSAFEESIDVQTAVLTTKAEHVALKSEILERVFNSTLKFDIAQRSMRDFLEHDFVTLKQDIHMMEKLDFEAVRSEIATVETKFKLQKEASDDLFDNLVKTNAKLEKRVLNYVAAFGTTIAIILAVLSSIIEKH
ncbi:Aste57867_3965 [Aphanomyces stellatus]|uniref:Aste57867_3965 protein n=1 Tax=Aphanomyces stellatus TaxID=120398 RepID=A0A485KAM8_9STRA|nr:hypothetical protein As57867_003954 [Aphanomyces stellatus]VFT81102.1 Aste57867_3965 [Aphanomyces stellatus]